MTKKLDYCYKHMFFLSYVANNHFYSYPLFSNPLFSTCNPILSLRFSYPMFQSSPKSAEAGVGDGSAHAACMSHAVASPGCQDAALLHGQHVCAVRV